jgi:hypothetical protein
MDKEFIFDDTASYNLANKTVKELRRQLGDYLFDENDFESSLRPRAYKKILLRNGACYLGECLVSNSVQEGRGVLLKYDGSLYEGFWQDNQPQYKGRVIYNNGDYYEGGFHRGLYEGLGIK